MCVLYLCLKKNARVIALARTIASQLHSLRAFGKQNASILFSLIALARTIASQLHSLRAFGKQNASILFSLIALGYRTLPWRR